MYLIHPAVVCGTTALYIWAYNRIATHDEIIFPNDDDDEEFPIGEGGEDCFWIGWTLVNAASHILVWPISYGLAQLPYLRDILL